MGYCLGSEDTEFITYVSQSPSHDGKGNLFVDCETSGGLISRKR